MGLELQIKKNLGEFRLDLEIEVENEVFALLGASGCGKSMTLRCIAGIVTPDEGRIVLNNRVLFDSKKKINLPPKERNVGFLFQNYALFPNMTVEQNIATGLRSGKNPKVVKNMLERLYLTEQEKHYPYQLSGGQQQRVALGRLLISEPEILLLDEPFSALDSYLKWQLEQELMDILEEVSLTTLFVSHNRDEVYRLCDRIGVIQKGTLSSVDEKVSLFENPKTLSAALLSGCKNISRVKAVDNGIELIDWGITLQSTKPLEPDTLYAGIRAHYFYVATSDDLNAFPCVVTRVVEDVFTTSLILTSEQTPSNARRDYAQIMWKLSQQHGTKEHVKYKVGDKLFLGVSPDDVLLLSE